MKQKTSSKHKNPEEGQERLFGRQHATYTAFDKLRTLEQGNYRLAVDYGIDRQRVRQTFRRGSSTRTKRHFTPLYESITENGVTKNLHYLTAGTGLFAIFATQTNGESAMHYTLKDHQGSLAATVCGNAVERLSYDAWGRRRKSKRLRLWHGCRACRSNLRVFNGF